MWEIIFLTDKSITSLIHVSNKNEKPNIGQMDDINQANDSFKINPTIYIILFIKSFLNEFRNMFVKY